MAIARCIIYFSMFFAGASAYGELSVIESVNKRLTFRESLVFTYLEMNETVSVDEIGNYAFTSSVEMSEQLSIVFEFFKAAISEDLQRMLELSDQSMRESLEAKSEQELNRMFSQYHSSTRNSNLLVTHRFESFEAGFSAFRIGFPMRRSGLEVEAKYFFINVAMTKQNQYWKISHGLRAELDIVLRERFPYTNSLYKAKRLPTLRK